MKKILLFLIVFCVYENLLAQISLEKTYTDSDFLEIINLENSGKKYLKVDKVNMKLILYNLDHSIFNTITIPTQIKAGWDILYVSENLFDTDSEIEYILHNDEDYTIIYNENGDELLNLNTPSYYPPNIYDSGNGLKLVFNFTDKTSSVYSLPGTNVNALQNGYLSAENIRISEPYPNPSSDYTKIDYKLSKECSTGTIVLFDINGVEINRYEVDNTFDHLLIPTSSLKNGIYYYNLYTQKGTSETKKLLIDK